VHGGAGEPAGGIVDAQQAQADLLVARRRLHVDAVRRLDLVASARRRRAILAQHHAGDGGEKEHQQPHCRQPLCQECQLV
jgi:hypothetical protein